MATAITLIVYGLITEAIGLMEFRKTGAAASLMAGFVCGLVLTLSGVLVLVGIRAGTYIGAAATGVVIGVFWMAYSKTRSLMPAGLMLAVSSIAAGILFTQIFQ